MCTYALSKIIICPGLCVSLGSQGTAIRPSLRLHFLVPPDLVSRRQELLVSQTDSLSVNMCSSEAFFADALNSSLEICAH
jgi:hypothetical protein